MADQSCVSVPTSTLFSTGVSTVTITTFTISTTLLPPSSTTFTSTVCSTALPQGTILTPSTTCTVTTIESTAEASPTTTSVPVTTTSLTTTSEPTSTLFSTSCTTTSGPPPTSDPDTSTSTTSTSSSSSSSSSTTSPPPSNTPPPTSTTTKTLDSPQTSSASKTGASSVNTSAVIGGVAGGIGGAVILLLIGWFLFRKKRRVDLDEIVWPDLNQHHEKHDTPGAATASDNNTADTRPYAYGSVAATSPTGYSGGGGYSDSYAGGYTDYVPQNTYPPTAAYNTPPINQSAYASGYAPHAGGWNPGDHLDVPVGGLVTASRQSPPLQNIAPRQSYSTAGHSSTNSETGFLATAAAPAGYNAASGYNTSSGYPNSTTGYSSNRSPSNASNPTQPLVDVSEPRRPLQVVNDDSIHQPVSEKTQYRLHPDTGLTAVHEQADASASGSGPSRSSASTDQRPRVSEKAALAARRDQPEEAPDAPPAYSAD